MWREGEGAREDDPLKKCDSGVFAWLNSDAVRMTFSFILDVRLARTGKRRVRKEGGGKQMVFEDRSIICLQPAIIYWRGNTRHPQLQ